MSQQEIQGSPEGYKGMYGSLKFPKLPHQEYPKLIYTAEGKIKGTANNAMEEKEIYASMGVDKIDIDPLGAALDEVALLREKLAQYEGNDPAKQIASSGKGKVQTSTVEMLPAEEKPAVEVAPTKEASKANPLLQKTPGSPLPVGSAPEIKKQLNPGV